MEIFLNRDDLVDFFLIFSDFYTKEIRKAFLISWSLLEDISLSTFNYRLKYLVPLGLYKTLWLQSSNLEIFCFLVKGIKNYVSTYDARKSCRCGDVNKLQYLLHNFNCDRGDLFIYA